MKVKDLKFVHGECGLMQFVCDHSHVMAFSVLKYFLVERVSSRSYYLFAKKFSSEFPLCNYRVSANADVSDLIFDVYKMLKS